MYLAWDGMWFTDFVSPISTTNWNNRQFSQNDGTTDGCGNFFAALNTKTDVTIAITDSNESLKTCTLTSTGLFLDWHNFQNFIFQLRSQESVNDFEFLDWQWVQVDFFQWTNFAFTNQTAQFRYWNPFFLVFFATTTSAACTTTTTATTTTTLLWWKKILIDKSKIIIQFIPIILNMGDNLLLVILNHVNQIHLGSHCAGLELRPPFY